MKSLFVLFILSLFTGCHASPSEKMAMMVASTDTTPVPEGACLPYGVGGAGPQWAADPNLDGTPVPTPTPQAPWPTCTPVPATPGPSPTPSPTSPVITGGSDGLTGATAPQNLSLSSWDEAVHRVAADSATGVKVVTWQIQSLRNDAEHGAMATIWAGMGEKTIEVYDILGVDQEAAPAVSSSGRLHLYAAGRYAFSDSGGVQWSAPTHTGLQGRDPVLVVSPLTRLARLFVMSDGALRTSEQLPDGSWSRGVTFGTEVIGYDAIPVGQGVVVAATNGHNVRIFRFPDPAGPVTSYGHKATHINLTYRLSQVMVGIGCEHDGGSSAVIGRSLDDGYDWEFCGIQTEKRISSVAVFPTRQGPYAALWVWYQPNGQLGRSFPYIALSTVRWSEGDGCAASPSGSGSAPHPGLFASRSAQRSFRLRVDDGLGFLAFEGETLGQDSIDVFVADLNPDRMFSGMSLGVGQPGEGGP